MKKSFILLVMLSLCGGAGVLFSMKNTERNALIEVRENKPNTKWLSDENPTSREMETATRKKLTEDYINAWKQWGFCLINQDTTGLYANWTPFLRQVIRKNCEDNLTHKIIQKDKNHVLKLRFYTLDGQVISVEDSMAVEQSINGIINTQSRKYDILFLLEEGHWRIKYFKLN